MLVQEFDEWDYTNRKTLNKWVRKYISLHCRKQERPNICILHRVSLFYIPLNIIFPQEHGEKGFSLQTECLS